MFGLEYKTLLKKDIIEILDNAVEPLSVEAIQSELGYSNFITVQDNCNELIKLTNELYTEEECCLLFHTKKRRSISLERRSNNLQSLYRIIFSKDISFEIIYDLIQKREFSSIDFCLTKNISKSTLQRKIRRINQDLRAYRIHISCSDKVKFKADELDIRFFSSLFLWSTHRTFSCISSIPNTVYFTNTLTAILNYLKVKTNPVTVETLSFIFYIYWKALSKGKKVILSKKQSKILADFTFPPRCESFLSWEEQEWQNFLLTLYCIDLCEFQLEFDQVKLADTLGLPLTDVFLFKDSLTEHFGELTSQRKDFIDEKWIKYSLAFRYFQVSADSIECIKQNVQHIVNFKSLKNEHPIYWEKFSNCWDIFLTNCSNPSFYQPMKDFALLICLKVFPISNNITKLSVHIATDIGNQYTGYLKKRIELNYDKKYKLSFVNDIDKAKLIISTIPIKKDHLRADQQVVTVSAHLRENDFHSLDIALFKQCYPQKNT